MGKFFVVTNLLFVILFSQNLKASTGEIYGYGSKASALGNTALGGSSDGYATFYNPAANSANPGFQAGLSFIWLAPEFHSINNVVIKNSVFNPTLGSVRGDATTDNYNDQIGQSLGVSYNLGEKWRYLAIGVAGYLPLERLAYLDTGESFKPEYFMYRSRTQRPQMYTSVSISPFSHFFVGVGAAIAFNMDANATILTTESNSSASSARFSASMKPNIAPYGSLYTDWKPISAAVVFRYKNRFRTSLDTGADARIFRNADFSVTLNAASTLYYDPTEVDLSLAWHINEKNTLVAEADWFEYSSFEVPTLTIAKTEGGSQNITNSISTAPSFKNIFVPKIGYEHVWGKMSGRLGALYRPSPVESNAGNGNLIDPAKMVMMAGLGFDLHAFGLTDHKIRIDIHGQYHHLFRKTIVKNTGNELGNTAESRIGSPGYDIGGRIYGGGLTASVEL